MFSRQIATVRQKRRTACRDNGLNLRADLRPLCRPLFRPLFRLLYLLCRPLEVAPVLPHIWIGSEDGGRKANKSYIMWLVSTWCAQRQDQRVSHVQKFSEELGPKGRDTRRFPNPPGSSNPPKPLRFVSSSIWLLKKYQCIWKKFFRITIFKLD